MRATIVVTYQNGDRRAFPECPYLSVEHIREVVRDLGEVTLQPDGVRPLVAIRGVAPDGTVVASYLVEGGELDDGP